METPTLNLNILDSLYAKFADFLPKALMFIAFIVIGWLALKAILYLAKKLLKLTKIDKLSGKINNNDLVEKLNIKINPSSIILSFLKWFLILVLVIIGADMLKLSALSEQTAKLIAYLPNFFTALLLFLGGVYLANLLKKSVYSLLKSIDLSGAKLISLILFYFLIIMISITALNQAGVNTNIITNNLFLIIGAFLAAFTIAFGLGSRDIVYRLLLGFYTQKSIRTGSRVKIGDIEGIVLDVSNIYIIIKTSENKVVLPIKQLNNHKIEILD
ncbi:hypothetical protein GGR32_001526 [Mesonia hippocampi]|uniref:Mechanosensitive ion channel MscS domain-containing protein n=1 Tax=Mesonia hippocampi TaxID=1628250 RepID=A0A840EQI2_9FLAO|nr:mechanosensitive ion channel domain-containing protein [Mesonia hippocampi]MBB4119230.1 hypothetical protein [Mesonia hippocampi]